MVARIERSEMRDAAAPDFAALNPGYGAVRYLGIEVDDAIAIAEQVDV